MAQPNLVLFEDVQVHQWEPFALTRPAGELIFGSMRLVQRVERATGLTCRAYLSRDHLREFREEASPPVLSDPGDLPNDIEILYWCSRAVPDLGQRIPLEEPGTVYVVDDRPVGYLAPAGSPPHPGFLKELDLDRASRRERAIDGCLLEWIWELMVGTPERLRLDLQGIESRHPKLPEGVHAIGDHALVLDDGVTVDPPTFFDLRDGPIHIGRETEVLSGTRLKGPAVIGAHSRLLGGSLEAISAGPYSYLHGEVSHAVILGYTNKAHDGYLGHAYVGRWVNLGAFTTNSDLKNNYHTVKVWTPAGVRDTGELKIGCFLGDHTKTGIGLLLGTGAVVGAGSNVFGTRMPPRYIAPFSWGEADALGPYRLEAFLDTAARSMARRGVALDDQARRYLTECWRKGRGE